MSETSEVLGLSRTGAVSRYLRAIERLKDIVARIRGVEDL